MNNPVMEYVEEGDKGCPKVNNVGAKRVCHNFDIVSNMNVCTVTLVRTVRDGAMGMFETGSSPSSPRSRSRQRARSSSRQGAGSSSSTSSPLRGTLKTITMTSTSRRLSTLGRGASPSTL